jgi:hypothetical protein
MSAQQEIANLLEQWLQLTQAETCAIQAESWPSLKEIQTSKSRLQGRLTQAKEQWEAENPGKVLTGPGNHPFYTDIGRLLSMETRNGELLAIKLRRAHVQRESLNEAARNLRNVQQTYASKSEGAWNRYS